MPSALRPVSKRTMPEPVSTTVGVKKNCALSVGMKFAALTSANSSGGTLIPKISCGFSTVRVPARSVETSKSPSMKLFLIALGGVMLMPCAAAGRTEAAEAAAKGSAAPLRSV
jgi:hypothetical protein